MRSWRARPDFPVPCSRAAQAARTARCRQSAPKPDGRGHHYELTSAGHDLFKVCESLGEWGARWLEIAPENLDPFVALWSMCNALRRDRLPDRRVVIRFDFLGRPHRERYWLLIELGDTEISKTCPGVDEDLYITADAEAFVKWHAGQLTWAQATRDGRIQLDGLPSLVRAFPTWNARSMFAHIRPVSRTAHERCRLTSLMAASRPSRDPETSAVLADPRTDRDEPLMGQLPATGCTRAEVRSDELLPGETRTSSQRTRDLHSSSQLGSCTASLPRARASGSTPGPCSTARMTGRTTRRSTFAGDARRRW